MPPFVVKYSSICRTVKIAVMSKKPFSRISIRFCIKTVVMLLKPFSRISIRFCIKLS